MIFYDQRFETAPSAEQLAKAIEEIFAGVINQNVLIRAVDFVINEDFSKEPRSSVFRVRLASDAWPEGQTHVIVWQEPSRKMAHA